METLLSNYWLENILSTPTQYAPKINLILHSTAYTTMYNGSLATVLKIVHMREDSFLSPASRWHTQTRWTSTQEVIQLIMVDYNCILLYVRQLLDHPVHGQT